MVKKIGVIVVVILFLAYSSFVGYQYYNNYKSLNSLIKTKVALESDYNSKNGKITTLEKRIADLNVEKEAIKVKIIEQENNLKLTNDKIAVRQAEISNSRELQLKVNIKNGVGTKMAYLTFDDGPTGYTSTVLNILNEYGIKATFFVNGKEDAYSLGMYRRIVNEGHSIGNHTYYHNYQTNYSSVDAFNHNFNRLQTLILNTTGVTMDIMRFPGGSNNATANSYSAGIMDVLTSRYRILGYSYFDWNSSAGDTAPSGVTTSSVINKITNECRYKSYVIVLMHDSLPTTPTALEPVILNLASFGFKFRALSSSSSVIQFK